MREVVFTVIVRREDEVLFERRFFGDANRIIEQSLHHRPQEQFLIGAVLQSLDACEIETWPVNVRLQHVTVLIRMRRCRRLTQVPDVQVFPL